MNPLDKAYYHPHNLRKRSGPLLNYIEGIDFLTKKIIEDVYNNNYVFKIYDGFYSQLLCTLNFKNIHIKIYDYEDFSNLKVILKPDREIAINYKQALNIYNLINEKHYA